MMNEIHSCMGGNFLKQKLMAIVCVLCATMMFFAGVCAAKGKKADDGAQAQQATLAHIQKANALCSNFTCRYDEEANVYTFVPKEEVLARLSGKAATMIPSVAYAGKDNTALFSVLFSYGGVEYADLTDVTLVLNGKEMDFTVPEGASAKEDYTAYVTEEYAAQFDGDILDEFYAFATSETTADAKDVLKLTGKTASAERRLTPYDKEVLKEAIDIYRALSDTKK